MDTLVTQIKTLQRSDSIAKQAWWEYCDSVLNGIRDPAKHEASVLETFLIHYTNGTLEAVIAAHPPSAAPAPSAPKAVVGARPAANRAIVNVRPTSAPISSSLAEGIKSGQRHSASWKTAWQTYCTLNGTGKFDPASYDDGFITSFLEYLGNLAITNMGGAASVVMATSGVKRAAATASMPAAKRQHTSGSEQLESEDPAKAQLVSQIKALQRSDNAGKEAWWQYCDEQYGCVRDPSRHDTESLIKFLAEYSTTAAASTS